jgi:hypothetical protein
VGIFSLFFLAICVFFYLTHILGPECNMLGQMCAEAEGVEQSRNR